MMPLAAKLSISKECDGKVKVSGGTKASIKLGGEVAGILVMIELAFLNGRDKVKGYDLFTLLRYD